MRKQHSYLIAFVSAVLACAAVATHAVASASEPTVQLTIQRAGVAEKLTQVNPELLLKLETVSIPISDDFAKGSELLSVLLQGAEKAAGREPEFGNSYTITVGEERLNTLLLNIPQAEKIDKSSEKQFDYGLQKEVVVENSIIPVKYDGAYYFIFVTKIN